jgi:hypothetical protein
MNQQQKEQLLAYRKYAQENRMEKNRYLSDKEAVLLLANAIPTFHNLLLIDALKVDLQTRPLVDAIAQWCDPENGISRHFPDAILQIASNVLTLEKQSV